MKFRFPFLISPPLSSSSIHQYWVDPNSGDPKDAILAHCDMDSPTPATCIQPKPDRSGEIDFITREREVWFSDIPAAEGGFRLTYKADSNQITFLQMLSSRVRRKLHAVFQIYFFTLLSLSLFPLFFPFSRRSRS